MRAIYRRGPAALIAAGMILAVLAKTGIYFETNDDRYIASILSGVLTSKPDAHAVYVNYLLTFPLSLLYRITTDIPWYGGMLIIFQWMVYYNILNSAYSRCINFFQMLVITAVTGSFFIGYCYMLGLIQYTSTAALLAMAGYACLIMHSDEKKGIIIFGIFEMLAFLLRSNSMLMIQPFGITTVLAMTFLRQSFAWRKKLEEAGKIVFILILVFATGLAGNAMGGYYSKEWRQYRQFNDTMTALFDYHGKPEYDEVREILDKYNISENKYKAYCSYTILDWNTETECDRELEEYVSEHNGNTLGIGDVFQEVYNYSYKEFDWKMNTVAIAAWILWIVFVLSCRRWSALLPGICLAVSKTAVWGALIWMGRMPYRIVIPLFACETMLLLAICRSEYVHTRVSWLQRIIMLLICLNFFYVSAGSFHLQYRYIRELNEGQRIYIRGLEEIQDYCDAHPENRYLLDANSMTYYEGSALETGIYHPANNVISGGWFSAAPNIQEHLERYLSSGENGLYFMIYGDSANENNPAMQYLSEMMNTNPVLADKFTASHGGSYDVYYFEGTFSFENHE